MNEAPAHGLSDSLRRAGFRLGRLQTGTPARLDKKTINFENLEPQHGDTVPSPFSFMNLVVDNAVRVSLEDLHFESLIVILQGNQVVCYKTTTTPDTHQIVKDNIHLSVHIQEANKGWSISTSGPC
jgi:tRNA uridine 5-carboxymethylaminomethyl modification enzyme